MSTEQQLSYIQNMVEDLINENAESSQINFHKYLQEKSREMIIGEMCDDDVDEDDDEDDDDDKKKDDDKKDDDDKKVDEAFAQPSEGSMSKKISGKIQYKKGGKKTAKKHGNSAPGLCGKTEKTKFKSGGKQPAKTLEKTPKPISFNDGRDYSLGTT